MVYEDQVFQMQLKELNQRQMRLQIKAPSETPPLLLEKHLQRMPMNLNHPNQLTPFVGYEEVVPFSHHRTHLIAYESFEQVRQQSQSLHLRQERHRFSLL